MTDLSKLYNANNPICNGCSILQQSKPIHAYLDYEKQPQVDLLFVVDCFKWAGFEMVPFTKEEQEIFDRFVPSITKGIRYSITAAIKCPSVYKVDMGAKNKKICRQHLDATMEHFKPKLVILLGNMPLDMLCKKSGINNKRGTNYDMETESGHKFVAVPTLHPFVLVKDIGQVSLFQQDLQMAINRHIKGEDKKLELNYKIIRELSGLEDYNFLFDYEGDIAIDTETTGLDFMNDKLMTVSIAWEGHWGITEIVIPFIHYESPFDEDDREVIIEWLSRVFENPLSRKILENAKFDMKFTKKAGMRQMVNVWDTAVMAHLENENLPKGLADLVKRFFPEYVGLF